MIKLNATTHTDFNGNNGATISTGAVINVNFVPLSRRVYDSETGAYTGVTHDIQFSTELYKNMASYESPDSVFIDVLANPIKEFDVNFVAQNVDIQVLTSVSDLLQLFVDHIEDGGISQGKSYPGIGTGNAEIVWPS